MYGTVGPLRIASSKGPLHLLPIQFILQIGFRLIQVRLHSGGILDWLERKAVILDVDVRSQRVLGRISNYLWGVEGATS